MFKSGIAKYELYAENDWTKTLEVGENCILSLWLGPSEMQSKDCISENSFVGLHYFSDTPQVN
jgi:hypothetical protein